MKILKENNINYSLVEYIKNGIRRDELTQICQILNIRPIDIVRRSDTNYKELNVSEKNEQDDNYMINIIIQNPKILQRPIIIKGQKGVIGRPPETIKELL